MVERWCNDQYDRDSLPWTSETRFFVIVNHYDFDVEWRHQLQFPHVVYTKEQPDKEPFTAGNKAKSESNILKFIYQFYDYLPENLITVHQYNRKYYHRGSLVEILNDSKFLQRYQEKGNGKYWCFNWPPQPTLERHIDQMIASGWWEDCMQPYFGPIEYYGDFILGQIGCAQYVVNRERIRSVPREFYKNAYDWIMKYTLDESIPGIDSQKCRGQLRTDGHCRSNWSVSRYLEWTWETIFTVRPSVDAVFPFPYTRIPLPSELDRNKQRSWVDVCLDLGKFQAVYGGLDVTEELTRWLTMGPNRMNPVYFGHEADMNLIFTDPQPGQFKYLIITLGHGAQLHISEDRRVNFWFHLDT